MSSRGTWALAIEIEGIGLSQSTDRLYRFATSTFDGDSDGAYLAGSLVTWPRAVESSVDFLSCSSSTGGMSFGLRASGLALSRLMRLGAPEPVARLAVDLTASNPEDVVLNMIGSTTPGSLNGLEIVTEREVIRLAASNTGAGPYTWAACQRARWGTVATAHTTTFRRGLGARADTEVFLASHFPVAQGRVVRLLRVPVSGSSYSAEETLWRGVLRSVSMPSLERIEVSADDFLSFARERQLWRAPWRGTRRGSSIFVGPSSPVAFDDIGSFTSYGLFAVAGGESAVRALWLPDLTEWPTRSEVSIAPDLGVGSTAYLSGLRALDDDELDKSEEIVEAVSTHPQAPPINDDGDLLSASLFTLAQQLLASTDADTWGDGGPNGARDLGRSELGCAVPSARIDSAAFDAMQLALADEAVGEGLWITESTGALDVITAALRLVGAAIVTKPDGTATVRRNRSILEGGEVGLTEADFKSVEIEVDAHRDRRLARVVVEYGGAPGVEAQRQSFDHHIVQRRHPSLSLSEESVDGRCIGGRGFEAAQAQARLVAIDMLERWGYHPAEVHLVGMPTTSLLSSVGAGDLVTVSHSLIPGSDSTLGLSSVAALVTSHSIDLDSHEVAISLLLVGLAHASTGLWAPSAIVGALDGAASVTVGNDYSASLLPGQTDDAHGFSVGSTVQVRTRDRGTTRGTATITALPAGKITFDGRPAGTAAGDVVELRDYDAALAGDRSTFAFAADDSDTLGAGNAVADEWGG